MDRNSRIEDSLPAAPEEPAPDRRAARRGTAERGASPWLGSDEGASAELHGLRVLERRLMALLPMQSPVTPFTGAAAFFDWSMHLGASPAKQAELAWQAVLDGQRYWQALVSDAECRCGAIPLPQDKRFAHPDWCRPPYAALAQAFLLTEQWWQRATTHVPGVTRHHERMLSFAARQWLDLCAPSNAVATNPEVLARTVNECGANLVRGAWHAVDDAWREALDLPPAGAERWVVGTNVAASRGRVVLRNRLMELIQYAPATPTVHAEPVLLVPAWIMKYYVLDLAPEHSLVRFLVERGHTVFAISWKNPDAGDRDLTMADYHALGPQAALEAIATIVPGARTHALGYCLGGTLMAMTAARLGRAGSPALASLTLLAAQTDFADPGELSLFIDESQVDHLEGLMERRGTLDKRDLRQTFQLLRSRDLIWSYRLVNYLLGERLPVSDLMAWNADGTRLPQRMHSEYLRAFYLDNALARGDYALDGVPINLHDIRVPVFVLGAMQDHVAPWRSVFKLNHLCDAEQTYVLTAGGHNVGVVNPPGGAPTSHRLRVWQPGDRVLSGEEWLAETPTVEGSWWLAWADWLVAHGSARWRKPPRLGAPRAGLPPLDAAPGTYVLQR